MSLEDTEAECAVAGDGESPRVALGDIKDRIDRVDYFTLSEALGESDDLPKAYDLMMVAVVLMKNGFTIIGKSAPASPERFDAELGRKLAYEDAVRQAWPFEGYLLRERLSKES